MSRPQVSVIVPVYGVEAYLDRCVESILKSDYKDFELILVDDGSPDRCPEMCDRYAEQDKRIKVVHKANGGLTSARLAGYECCQGDYVLFLDSDDFIAPEMISTLYKSISESQADLAICSWFTERGGNVIPNHLYIEGELTGRDAVINKYVLPLVGRNPRSKANLPGFMCIRLFNRQLMRREMFVSERDYITEDILFNLMYGLEINKVVIVNRPLYYYCYNGASLTMRYRENVFPKMMARYDYCVKLCTDNHIYDEAKERLMYNLLSAVCFSILNACKMNSYSEARKEIRVIFGNDKVSRLFKQLSKSSFDLQQYIIYLAYRTKGYFIMYRYLRWRMGL